MPMPTLAKTWQHSQVSVSALGSLALQNADTMFRLKNALVSFGTLPWTVVSSSDSSTAGASDKWLAAANCVWANSGSNHSWIVLKQTGIASNFQICIDLNVSAVNGSQIALIVSPSAGFTGGSITARPTATDEAALYTARTWSYGTAAAAQQFTYMQSTDGQCTRFIVWKGAVAAACWVLDKPQGLPASLSGWASPFVALVQGTSGGDFDAATYANLNGGSGNNLRLRADSSGTVASCFLAAEGSSATAGQNQTVANEASSEWPLAPVAVTSDTNQARGRWGYLADCWLGSTTPVSGDVYPASGTKTLITVGDLVLPWDNSTVPTGGTARDGDGFTGVTNITQLGGLPYTVVSVASRPLGSTGKSYLRNREA